MNTATPAAPAAYRLCFTQPTAGELVECRRHFAVEGTVSGQAPLPPDAILTVTLRDAAGQVVRHVSQQQKNNSNLYLAHPDLVRYPREYDPDCSLLRQYGFPPLLVRDVTRPLESLRDATIKCWYSDTAFKAIIITATDVAHGLPVPDGMAYTDENGRPYTLLQQGRYTLTATLASAAGQLLGSTSQEIVIGTRQHQAICRFNPPAHRHRMEQWCDRRGFSVIRSLLPGYLEPYAGRWLYHMGLLPLYRASDLALFTTPHIHMFLYNITPDSTSYETELAYLQAQCRLGDDSFTAYCYDIGEALLGEGTPYRRRGRVFQFRDRRYLRICRVDIVTPAASENRFLLDGSALCRSLTHRRALRVPHGCRIAITGVVRPWQMEPADFTLRPDNTYALANYPHSLHYTFTANGSAWQEQRGLMMERIENGVSIGRSVCEFYNIFSIGAELADQTVTVHLRCRDAHGALTPAQDTVTLYVE